MKWMWMIVVAVCASASGARAQTAVDTEWTTADISSLLNYQMLQRDSLAQLTSRITVGSGVGMLGAGNYSSYMRAVLAAELGGAAQTYTQWNNVGDPSSLTYTPSGAGLLRTLASSSERAAIADSTKYSVWRQLDEIRQNTAGVGIDLTDTNAWLEQIRNALYNYRDTEWLEIIAGNTEATANQALQHRVAFDAWRGLGGYTWGQISSEMHTFFEVPTSTQIADGFPTPSFSGDGRVTGAEESMEYTLAGIKHAADHSDLPGPLQVPSDASYKTTPPVFTFPVNLSSLNGWSGTSFGTTTITVDMGLLPSGLFAIIKALILCFASWGGMAMVWEEVRRYG